MRDVLAAVLLGALQETAKVAVLARFCGNDKLAALPVGYATLAAIAIKQAPPGHTERGLQTRRLVVEPGMNDFAAARRRSASGAIFLFEEENLNAAERERSGDGKADHARADNDRLHLEHVSVPGRFFSRGEKTGAREDPIMKTITKGGERRLLSRIFV